MSSTDLETIAAMTATAQSDRNAPRRLRAADVIDTLETALVNVTNRPTGEPSASVELSRNAKGDVQYSVKVYATAHAAPDDVAAATAKAYDEATQAFDALATLYPFTPPAPKEK